MSWDYQRAYFRKTGNKYIYQTAKMEFYFTGDPSKQCECVKDKCTSDFVLNLKMKILNLSKLVDNPKTYKLSDGIDTTGTSEQRNSAIPGPDVKTKTDEVTYSAGGEVFKQPDPRKQNYEAKANVKIPCKSGTYNKRFYLIKKRKAGKKNIPSGLIAYVDAVVTVTEVKGKKPCVLKISMKGYFLEFRAGYPWLPAAAPELPEIEYDMEIRGGGRNKGKTRNISKLIEEDGKKIDDPFPDP